MKEHLPAPRFDASRYERPTQAWVCGRSIEGEGCPLGPDPRGRCRATAECNPALDIKPGETKGRYRCTRPAERGGPCADGPLPDGTCARLIPKCQPVRSLRARRGLFTRAVIAFTVAVLLVLLYGPWRSGFINPGALSSAHTGPDFVRLGPHGTNDPAGCSACHTAAPAGLRHWISAAFFAKPGPFDFRELAARAAPNMTSMDAACRHCHPRHDFHQPTVAKNPSCTACHPEHRGAGPMSAVQTAHCAACHADPHAMAAAAEIGRGVPAAAFEFRLAAGRNLFRAPRPERGYTQVFGSFADDHPEFQVHAEGLKDVNPLRFNHARHFADDIPPLHGRKLTCADCHVPDASGSFHQKIRFETHCRDCHALQFDARNPDLHLPHGQPEGVRAFLRSLPAQYADFGARTKGITGRRELDEFVREQMRQLREAVGSGEALEQQVFFSDGRSAGAGPAAARARFAGCAYCHEVTARGEAVPLVAAAVVPDRWLVRSAFNHAKHTALACTDCHAALTSRETADILLPRKANCTSCHSPAGGVSDSCVTCHQYHHRAPSR